MNNLEKLCKTLDDLGIHYTFEEEAEGWGMPEYLEQRLGVDAWHEPPMVQQVILGCSHLYFDKEGLYLGWHNTEYSVWNERKKA